MEAKFERSENLLSALEAAAEETLAAQPAQVDADFLVAAAREATEDILPAEAIIQEKKARLMAQLAKNAKKQQHRRRRPMMIAASLAVVAIAAVVSVLLLPKLGVAPLVPSTHSFDDDKMSVTELLENLDAHAFHDVKLSDVFFEDDWSVSKPYYYGEEGKRCASFAVSQGAQLYCFTIKYSFGEEADYTQIGLSNVTKIQRETTIYIFDEGSNTSGMRYRLDHLSYDISANVSPDDMVETARALT